ncbi:MAG: adenosylcobinamide-phosphate synthase CbiB [Coriobacteriia bacterium]|nr:adenosylcobinamide-phosphate synthase CbiB [Coriobacteriia bacterium]
MTAWLLARPLALTIALTLDLALGDPHYRLHPVRLLGDTIATGERVLRRTRFSDRAAGTMLAASTLVLAAGSALALSMLAWRIGGLVAGVAVDAVLTYFALAGRALADEGRRVRERLEADDLPGARAALAGVVGRDTADLDESQISRAAIETLAENSVDALVATALWGLLLGLAGAWAHKVASTLDSMVGYRNERYERFGTAGAKLDDLLAWVPARIAIPLVTLAAATVRLDWRGAWSTGVRDRLRHTSPNSAHGEAAFAGALGVQLGGVVSYSGVASERPAIGAEFIAPSASDLRAAGRLLVAVETVILVCAAIAALAALALA